MSEHTVEQRTGTVLVTGATSGLGRALAGELAGAGWRVVVHGRDAVRVQALVDELGHDAAGVVADLSRLDDVRGLATQVTAIAPELRVLVNNAGVGFGAPGAGREVSADGHELRLAVNYLAPVLLTRELLPSLAANAPARVVNVGSMGQQPVDLADPEFTHDYNGTDGYRRAKLALAAWSFDLADKVRPLGVTVTCLHPATFMPTAMVRESGVDPVSSLEQGVRATLRLVIDQELDGVTGQFFNGLRPARALDQAYDPAFQAGLREVTDRLLAGRPRVSASG
jgi:NAD(P)-dependent dehydrogenase (short-subunit alcohol dehydrogenase family)